MNIDDDLSDIVETLMKIETKLLTLCEARNFLHMKDQRDKGSDRANEKTVEQYEKELNKLRMDKIVKEKQIEAKQQTELKEKMLKKAERVKNLKVFRGVPLMERSEKKEWKPFVV